MACYLPAGTFPPERPVARSQATHYEESSTEDDQVQDDVAFLKALFPFQQKSHPHQTGTVYREAQERMATEGSVPFEYAFTTL